MLCIRTPELIHHITECLYPLTNISPLFPTPHLLETIALLSGSM